MPLRNPLDLETAIWSQKDEFFFLQCKNRLLVPNEALRTIVHL